MAVVTDSLDEVRDYMEESGMDVQDLSDEELEAASEVFPAAGRTVSDCGRIENEEV